MDIKTQKSELRAAYLEKRAALTPEEKARRDAKICDAILSSASFRYAKTVLAYAPREHEVDIFPALRAALASAANAGSTLKPPSSASEMRSIGPFAMRPR